MQTSLLELTTSTLRMALKLINLGSSIKIKQKNRRTCHQNNLVIMDYIPYISTQNFGISTSLNSESSMKHCQYLHTHTHTHTHTHSHTHTQIHTYTHATGIHCHNRWQFVKLCHILNNHEPYLKSSFLQWLNLYNFLNDTLIE